MQIFTELYDSRTCNNFSDKTIKGIENKLTQIKPCDIVVVGTLQYLLDFVDGFLIR